MKPLLQSVNRTSGSNLTLDALVDGGGNFVWIGDPFEGFGMGVVIVEEAIDRGLEVSGVSSVIVEDGVDGLARGDLTPNCVEKATELLVWMALHVRPITVPSRTFIAANKVVVPCRL